VTELVLICGGCGSPAPHGYLCVRFAEIHDYRHALDAWHEAHPGDGHYIEELLTMPDEIEWRAWHYDCDPHSDEDAYQIDAENLSTWRGFLWWSAHLSSKNWVPDTDWDEVLREATGEIPSARIRIIEAAAA
jgi:hypothetical protein